MILGDLGELTQINKIEYIFQNVPINLLLVLLFCTTISLSQLEFCNLSVFPTLRWQQHCLQRSPKGETDKDVVSAWKL